MTVYLLRCQHGNQRYWECVEASLACTRDEVPRELARMGGVNLLHLVAYDTMPCWEVAALTGQDWTNNL